MKSYRTPVLILLILFALPIAVQLGYGILYTLNYTMNDNAPVPDGLWVADLLCFMLTCILYILSK